MDDGAGFIIDCFLPLLKRLRFKEKDIFNSLFLLRQYFDENFLYVEHIIGFKEYSFIYPVKIKHKIFSREPYLKLKSITITDECKLSSIQLETYITKDIKLISAYKKELELLKDF